MSDGTNMPHKDDDAPPHARSFESTSEISDDVSPPSNFRVPTPSPSPPSMEGLNSRFAGEPVRLVIGDNEEEDSEDERQQYHRWALDRDGENDGFAFGNNSASPLCDEEFLPSSFIEDNSADIQRLILNGRPMFQQIERIDDFPRVRKPPKVINDYLFGDLIGEGSYAKVKDVLHLSTMKRRAIKIFKERRIRKIPSGFKNIAAEANILWSTRHVNVIRIIDQFDIPEKKKTYFVFEFAATTISNVLDKSPHKRFDDQEACHFFKQLMKGIEYLHSCFIVHKDIKPSNLLVKYNGVLKISDFGIAEQLKDLDDSCQNSQGTPKFQPPETVDASSTYKLSFPMDIWSAGISLYNFLSGAYPFDGSCVNQLFDNISKQPLDFPETVQGFARGLLLAMLDKVPTERPTATAVLQSEFCMKTAEIVPFVWLDFANKHNIEPYLEPTMIESFFELFEQEYGRDEIADMLVKISYDADSDEPENEHKATSPPSEMPALADTSSDSKNDNQNRALINDDSPENSRCRAACFACFPCFRR